MRRSLLSMLIFGILLSGCASQEAYNSYTDAIVRANAYRQQPGITQEFDASGRLVKQAVIMPDMGVQVAQIKDSEWAQPISQALSLGMMGGMGWAITKELSGAIKSVQPNISGSYNQPGGNMAGGNVEIPTTTTTETTNTETITNPMAE